MASTYTPLGIELMATGENAGTWGTKTNTNLSLFEQITGGFSQVSIAGGAQTTALTIVDGNTTGTAQYRMIEFTGTITGNQVVTIPLDVETFYFLRNSTVGSFTVQFKYASGSGSTVTFSATNKGDKLIFAKADDATNPNVVELSLSSPPGGSDTQIQFNNAGAFDGSANLVWDGTNLNIGATGEIRLQDTTGGQYVGLKASGTVASSFTLVMPTATGTVDQVIKTDGSGNLSFATISGGAAWQAVITADPANAVAGEGYFCNTTSAAFTVTLPTAATIGDFISFIDYAGTFDTNNLTIARNGHNIQGAAADLTVATERAGFTLVYVDATQGWLLQNN
jgi:hypothetical protein